MSHQRQVSSCHGPGTTRNDSCAVQASVPDDVRVSQLGTRPASSAACAMKSKSSMGAVVAISLILETLVQYWCREEGATENSSSAAG
eukprot:6523367-Pyramimonas_sp.AAC.1